jgi:excisionase family DNA binding protein
VQCGEDLSGARGAVAVDDASRGGGKLLTAAEVGELLDVPASWVYEQSRLGRIPTVTLGRYRRYRRLAIERWIEQLEAAPTRRTP